MSRMPGPGKGRVARVTAQPFAAAVAAVRAGSRSLVVASAKTKSVTLKVAATDGPASVPVRLVGRVKGKEQPTRPATLVDLTCDSDGKVDKFIAPAGSKNALELHRLNEGEPYYLGIFLVGAYQDILGDIHNLFGRVTEVHVYADDDEEDNYFVEKVIKGTTVQEILAVVQYFPNDLQRRMEQVIQQKVKEGLIRPKVGVQLLDQYSKAFQEYTYLDSNDTT